MKQESVEQDKIFMGDQEKFMWNPKGYFGFWPLNLYCKCMPNFLHFCSFFKNILTCTTLPLASRRRHVIGR